MQCFQKDPNLRVSARKLLKHPWIVNARRTDSIIPTKSTEYEEAVKSVQEWNEALRSPNPNSTRKPLRPGHASPGMNQKDYPHPLVIPGREANPGPINRDTADKFRSPEAVDNNWDDDFASAISPSALQLPHLRPQDNFGGMLSSEKLKAFASLEGVTESNSIDNEDSKVLQDKEADPLQTIRPYVRKQPEEEKSPTKNQRYFRQRNHSTSTPKGSQIVAPSSAPPARPTNLPRPAAFYKESSIEDYSDLIEANDAVLERKLSVIRVSKITSLFLRTVQIS